MVNATIDNQAFKLKSLHPQNEEMLRQFGGIENLPPGARIPDSAPGVGRDLQPARAGVVTKAPQGNATRHVSLGKWSLC